MRREKRAMTNAKKKAPLKLMMLLFTVSTLTLQATRALAGWSASRMGVFSESGDANLKEIIYFCMPISLMPGPEDSKSDRHRVSEKNIGRLCSLIE